MFYYFPGPRRLRRTPGCAPSGARRTPAGSPTSSCPTSRPTSGSTLGRGPSSVQQTAAAQPLPGFNLFKTKLLNYISFDFISGVTSCLATRGCTLGWRTLCADIVTKPSWDLIIWASMRADTLTLGPGSAWRCCRKIFLCTKINTHVSM